MSVFTTLTGTLTAHVQGLYFKAFNERLFDTLCCIHWKHFISFWSVAAQFFLSPQHFFSFSERCRIKSMSMFSPNGFRHRGFKVKFDDSRLEVLGKHWALIAANGKHSLYGCELSFSELGICWSQVHLEKSIFNGLMHLGILSICQQWAETMTMFKWVCIPVC